MKRKTIITILAILLVASFAYIGIGQYNKYIEKQRQDTYIEAFAEGFEQAIIQIINEALKCRQLPLVAGNQSATIVAVECLK